MRIIGQRIASGQFSEVYHRELGRALGYPEEAIDRSIRLFLRAN
jgi:hypothetical protein